MSIISDIDCLVNGFTSLNQKISDIQKELYDLKKNKIKLYNAFNTLKDIDVDEVFTFTSRKNKLMIQKEYSYNFNKISNQLRSVNKKINNYLQILDKFNTLKKIIVNDGIFECPICCDFKINVVTGFCGHVVCEDCYLVIPKNKCPVCRENYNNKIIKLFY